jgi:prepilin-type N-terminal cleavage/methylation domain-containing protein
MERTFNRQRGYSLAELLVAVAVFALVILAALMIYDRSNRTFKLGVEASNLQQNTRVAFDKLVADLRMAGFDFDRDGIPTGAAIAGVNQYQQPDEQFEFIAPGALTLRSNFDFETEKTACAGGVTENCDNGREGTPNYESLYFPVVTTGNDEIVTYALVPENQAGAPPCNPATNCVEFFADTHLPRKSYPDIPGGGLDELVVQIPGVDLCVGGCNNPPYRLERITLARDQSNFANGFNLVRTPLATSIRSMTMTYYEDAQGTVPLRDLNNVVDHSTGENILGKGKFVVGNPGALVAERSIRSKINSVRISLIGMSEQPDPAYTDTAETIASARTYRKYRLDTLIAPRNILKRGMREQDTFAPGPPTNVQVCTGACAGVYISWDAPLVNAAFGAPDQYKVIYDLASATGYACETTTFTNTFMQVFGTGGCAIQTGQLYKFAVVALNSYGSAPSVEVQATPQNATQPAAPNLTSATNNLNGKVTLTWDRPTTNVVGNYSCVAANAAGPNAAELQGYRVYRSIAGSGVWGTPIADETTVTSIFNTVTWTDETAVNCQPYDYKVVAVEKCPLAPQNAGGNLALNVSPDSNLRQGQADAQGILPEAPSNLTIDQTGSAATCSLGVCDVFLSWPKVQRDTGTPQNPITVNEYRIYRQELAPIPGPMNLIDTLNLATIPPGDITYTDNNVVVAVGQQYQYQVTAVQCASTLESAPSVLARFPCAFPPLILNTPPVTSGTAFDGDGSAGNPWLVVNDADVTVDVLNPVPITRISANIYDGGGNLKGTQVLSPPDFRLTPTSPQYTFGWTLDPDATEHIDITVTETNGCVAQQSVYFRDEAQACCLVPLFDDPSVIVYTAGADIVDVILKNRCGELLDIDQIQIVWNSGITPGGTKVDSVTFPSSLGGTVTYNVPGGSGTNFIVPVPAVARNVAVGQTNYTIRLKFSKNLTNAVSPVTTFRVEYRRPSDPANVSCNAVP